LGATAGQSVQAVAIAASTGGPKALETLLPGLRQHTDVPILVVQHMPPDFTRSLAASLARLSHSTVIEAPAGLDRAFVIVTRSVSEECTQYPR